MELTTLYAAAGLSAGAGARAFLLLTALGGLHYTPWFTLSDGWLWLSSPVVLAVLGTLALLELAIDMHPDLAEFGDWAGYPTRAVAGFLVAAAWAGSLDPDLHRLVSEGALGASPAAAPDGSVWGLAGAGLALVVHHVRSKARQEVRTISDATDPMVDKGASVVETAAVAGLTASALWVPGLVPTLLVLGLVIAGALWWGGARWASKRTAARRAARAATRAQAAP